MSEQSGKRLQVAVCIVERNGRFLVIRRVDTERLWDKKWELPGGKIEVGESPTEAVIREVFEETGLSIVDPVLIGERNHDWYLPERTSYIHISAFTASSLSGDIRLDPTENDAFKWVTRDEYLAMDDQLEANKEIINKMYLK